MPFNSPNQEGLVCLLQLEGCCASPPRECKRPLLASATVLPCTRTAPAHGQGSARPKTLVLPIRADRKTPPTRAHPKLSPQDSMKDVGQSGQARSRRSSKTTTNASFQIKDMHGAHVSAPIPQSCTTKGNTKIIRRTYQMHGRIDRTHHHHFLEPNDPVSESRYDN